MFKCVYILIVFALFVSGCSSSFETTPSSTENTTGSPEPTEPEPNAPSLKICSKLDFEGILWPQEMSEQFQNSFALALNITSSFEGHNSWSALAGDFDGQGISLGLIQQNLGSGTLQPLFLQMQTMAPEKMKSHFSNERWKLIVEMLNDWSQIRPRMVASQKNTTDDLFKEDNETISRLDISPEDEGLLKATNASAIQKNLDWARRHVLLNKKVKPDWQKELKSLAASTEYKNIQFLESLSLHSKTEKYRSYFKFKSLIAYLFLFDVVVQNGGFKQNHRNEFNAYLQSNPRANEMAQLKKLLEIRLKSVRNQYKADVSARKNTILSGEGTVHGSRRDLNREYCYADNIVFNHLN